MGIGAAWVWGRIDWGRIDWGRRGSGAGTTINQVNQRLLELKQTPNVFRGFSIITFGTDNQKTRNLAREMTDSSLKCTCQNFDQNQWRNAYLSEVLPQVSQPYFAVY